MADLIIKKTETIESIELRVNPATPKELLNIRVFRRTVFAIPDVEFPDGQGSTILADDILTQRGDYVDFHPDKVPTLKAAYEQLVADGMIVDPNPKAK